MRNLILALTVLLTVALSMSNLHASGASRKANSTIRTCALKSVNQVVKAAGDNDENDDDDDDNDDQDDGDGDHQHEHGNQQEVDGTNQN